MNAFVDPHDFCRNCKGQGWFGRDRCECCDGSGLKSVLIKPSDISRKEVTHEQ